MFSRTPGLRACTLSLALGCCLAAGAATKVSVSNLVTDDQTAHPAQITDPGLKNAWGISYSPTSAFWVSSNGAGTSTLYTVNPNTQATSKSALTVAIPGNGSVTGQVFNAGSDFHADRFLFVSEDGTVSGWRGALGSTAETLAVGSSANVYKGAALGTLAGASYLYAANFRSGSIDVLKGNALAPGLTGNFTDPNLPVGYAPFNVQNLGGSLYVTYAKQDAARMDEVAGAGLGFVDRYDLDGDLLGRVASAGSLDAPWGLAIAPASFGALAGALLVGNFGDGRISAFDLASDAFLGQLLDVANQPLSIDGLWALAPGNGGSGGSTQSLYFTAGPDDETHGLVGVLNAAPEPGSVALVLAALMALASVRRGRWQPLRRA
ncbi:MAG: TIGR03118 family protein [Rhodoferax sp.]|nr:TIGR03118 family protein [Rhodoferax sp.]